ncbi:MAG: RNA-binding cell elongation regulator Jag/EloR [Clostridiales bacterium]
MINTVEKTGRSVEEAVNLALQVLNCTREQAEIEILTAPAKGFLGIGAKDAKVRVWLKEKSTEREELKTVQSKTENPKAENPKAAETREEKPKAEKFKAEHDDKTAQFILDVTSLMGIEAAINKEEKEESILYTLSGPRMGAVIGRRGDTLDALQYLSNIIAGRDKEESRKRIVVDAEDYRQRREDTLIRLAERLANKAKRSGHRVVLEPMSPMERRVIHTALQNDPEIKTQSEGEEPYRRLVIYPAGGETRYSGSYEGRTNRYGREGYREGRGSGSGGYGNRGYRKTGSSWSQSYNEGGDQRDEEA